MLEVFFVLFVLLGGVLPCLAAICWIITYLSEESEEEMQWESRHKLLEKSFRILEETEKKRIRNKLMRL